MSDPFKQYLTSLQTALAAGNATEHTHRPALKALLEALEPGVMATNEPKQVTDCGKPDMAVRRGAAPLGYLETKDVGINLEAEAKGPQLRRYREALPNLILSDYLEFRWYVNGERRAGACLGTVERDGKIRAKKEAVAAVGDLLAQFLALKLPSIGTAKELALRMAKLAWLMHNAALKTLEVEPDTGTLKGWLAAFEKTLVPNLSPEQFADMYSQTLTYGLFAAKVSMGAGQDLRRDTAAGLLPETNPFLKKLFYHLAGPEVPPTVSWVVDDMVSLLNAADLEAVMSDFGRGSLEKDPVVHFYETFLAAYDPEKRKVRGVYYTPEPVVSYIVRAIDYLLKDRFSRPWGLADKNTLILDPACGTGTFLHSVIALIYDTLCSQGQAGGWASYVSQSLLPRIFGFELLMAPYAVAHLKLGLLLKEKGFDFPPGQRLGVYLTNTLDEGIKKAEALLGPIGYITEESNAAARIKKDEPIEVVLGNPPYAVHSANASVRQIPDPVTGKTKAKRTWIGSLIEDYKQIDCKPLKEQNPKMLHDDYVKFLRWGQWRITRTGRGVLAMITNHGYLDNPTFRGMRQQLMQTFSEIYLLNLHGNAKKKEVCPDGSKDENVFDIQQGVAIGIFVKTAVEAQPWAARPHQEDAVDNVAQAPSPVRLAKPAKGEYRRNLPHIQAEDRPVFVTFRTFQNFILPESVRDLVLRHCLHDHGKKLWMHGAVVMPDHVHLLFTPLRDNRGNPFGLAEIMHGIKGASAHSINRALARRGHVWQDESFDHVLRSHESAQSKAQYICENPVRRGLVTEMDEYPWLWREWLEGDVAQAPPPGGAQPGAAVPQKDSLGDQKNVAPAPSPVLPSRSAVHSAQPGAAVPHLNKTARIFYADLWGTRKGKNQTLGQMEVSTTPWQDLQPQSPFYLFAPQDTALEHEFKTFWNVMDIFPVNSTGVKTHRDHFVFDFEYDKLLERIASFRNLAFSNEKIAVDYDLNDTRDWKLNINRNMLAKMVNWKEHLTKALYRPFDIRYYYHHEHVVELPRDEIMRHLLAGDNLSLNVGRAGQVTGSKMWDVVLCNKLIVDVNLFRRGGNVVFPLYLFTFGEALKGQRTIPYTSYWPSSKYGRTPNLNPTFIKDLSGKVDLAFIPEGRGDLESTFGPQDVFSYAYAVFHAPTYRQRYAGFLKMDFPRLPLTGNQDLFKALAGLGAELVSLHLMESPRLENFITRFPVRGSNWVEEVRYVTEAQPGAAVPHKAVPLKHETNNVAQAPSPVPRKTIPPELGRVYLNETQYFEGVPPGVWAFTIGGYQVCHKWLKDRKGRQLSFDDLHHYQKVVAALAETIRLMGEIDAVIEVHGGWPIDNIWSE